MAAPTNPIARPEAVLYVTPDHRVWLLNRDYLDAEDTVWHWDGRQFDTIAGPEMVSPALPLLHMPLIGLARFCRLHSDMRDATARGELVCQQHDATEAGYTQPACPPGGTA
jgi:hypothetical protein